MEKKKEIRRAAMLQDMELKEDHEGKPRLFACEFYLADGSIVSLAHARTCGLKANMKKERLRGIQATTAQGNDLGHPYPVSIDNFRTYNQMKVTV